MCKKTRYPIHLNGNDRDSVIFKKYGRKSPLLCLCFVNAESWGSELGYTSFSQLLELGYISFPQLQELGYNSFSQFLETGYTSFPPIPSNGLYFFSPITKIGSFTGFVRNNTIWEADNVLLTNKGLWLSVAAYWQSKMSDYEFVLCAMQMFQWLNYGRGVCRSHLAAKATLVAAYSYRLGLFGGQIRMRNYQTMGETKWSDHCDWLGTVKRQASSQKVEIFDWR